MNQGMLSTPRGRDRYLRALPFPQYALLRHELATGSSYRHGNGAWTTHTINTIVTDDDGVVVKLANDKFTLLPGKYRVRARSFAMNIQQCALRLLRDDGVVLSTSSGGAYGSPGTGLFAAYTMGTIWLMASFDVDTPLPISYQFYTVDDWGAAWHEGIGGGPGAYKEIFDTIELWRVAA